jgi:hypothetical protein
MAKSKRQAEWEKFKKEKHYRTSNIFERSCPFCACVGERGIKTKKFFCGRFGDFTEVGKTKTCDWFLNV